MGDTWLRDILGYRDIYLNDEGPEDVLLPRRKAIRISNAVSVADNPTTETTDIVLGDGEPGSVEELDGDAIGPVDATEVVALHIGAQSAAITTWAVGELFARTATGVLAGVRWLLRGSGSPDGVVSGSRGNQYQNSDDGTHWRNTHATTGTTWERLWYVPSPVGEADGKTLQVESDALVWGDSAGASTTPLRFAFAEGASSPGDPGDGNFTILTADYAEASSAADDLVFYVSTENVDEDEVAMLLAESASIGSKLTVRSADYSTVFTYDVVFVKPETGYLIIETTERDGTGGFDDTVEYIFEFEFAHLPPNVGYSTSGAVTPSGSGTGTSITPTWENLEKGYCPVLAIAVTGSATVTAPAGQGWVELRSPTTWSSTRKLYVFGKMWGVGNTDDLTPTFTVSSSVFYAYAGCILRGLDRDPTTNTLTVIGSGGSAVTGQPYIGTSNPVTEAGGLSLRVVATDDATLTPAIATIVTDGKAFGSHGTAAIKVIDVAGDGAESDIRISLWLEAHALRGRVQSLIIGPQGTSVSSAIAEQTFTFRPRRS